jgi:hypothetical protein
MRPRGTYGEVALALRDAALVKPGPVTDLAQRAQVAYGLARCTASRLVDAGQLIVVSRGRPRVLAAPSAAETADVGAVMAGWPRGGLV